MTTATAARQLVSVLALTSAVGLAMLTFRLYYGGTWGYRSLPWDLFLAWLPVPLALAVAQSHARGRTPWPRTLLLAFAWLLFFPNAPYLVTQFMHLHPSYGVFEGPLPDVLLRFSPRGRVPLWFDVLMLSTFAWTGLLLGFLSLHLVHRTAARQGGRAAGWAVTVVGLTLCAFGISLGRFERWNSWDILVQPVPLLGDVAARVFQPWSHPRTSAVTLGFAAFLLLAYLSLVALIRLGSPGDDAASA
jgi:uncharacterized membrane protein